MSTSNFTNDCPFQAALRDTAPKWGHENSSGRAQLALARNRAELALAAECLCQPEDDARHHVTCLTTDLGQSEAAVRDYRKVGLMMERLPKLAKVLSVRGFAPLKLLKKLAAATLPVGADFFEDLEPLLLAALTPPVDKLAMPDWKELFPKIQGAIDSVHHAARPADLDGGPVPKEVEETFARRRPEAPEKAHRIALNLAPAHAEEAHRVISTISATKECDGAEAFMHLVRGTAEVGINLHLYRGTNGGPAWMPGVGILSESLTAEYMSMVTSVDTVGPSTTGGYAATSGQRAFVIGRDGACMFPGCAKSAVNADMDHITNYDDGGPTSTDNLHALCRRHHNEKTKGLWDVTRSLAGTEYWTSATTGAQVATEASGPLRHPGMVPFAASVRKAAELRKEHNVRRDLARAECRESVAQARDVQPIVRMLQEMRIMAENETADEFIASITKHEAAAATEAATRRSKARHERQRMKLLRFRAEVESTGPIREPEPPSVEKPEPIVEMLQVYLHERDPIAALSAIGKLLAKVDTDEIKPWETSFADQTPLRQKIADCQMRRFRQKVRRATAARAREPG